MRGMYEDDQRFRPFGSQSMENKESNEGRMTRKVTGKMRMA